MGEAFKPTIGKTVLETLTSGMYDDARFIFREYIQNAADQIDEAVELEILASRNEGFIDINIDAASRRITISDNATGVLRSNVAPFLGDVANSQKDTLRRKGFRGIGRLGGLGYCDRLIFETSYLGEPVKSRVTLDAKLLRKIIENRRDNSDARAAMAFITIEDPPQIEEKNEHYFRVILENVNNDDLLNVEYVTEYLSMVAPVPFSSLFTFSEVIKAFLNSRNLVLDEYNIEVNKETLFKRYKNYFTDDKGKVSKLIGVDFVDIRNDLQELIAICWYGYRDYSNISLSANDIERGIRIRTKNISIGDETTCNRLFNVEKTNQRFIGEIHTLSDGFIPNARRDYFNENATCQQFEKNARVIFKAENLENRLAQTASKLHNKLEEIQQYRVKFDEFRILKGAFESEAAESFHLNKLKELEEKAIKAKAEIDKIKVKANEYPNVRTLYKSVIGDTDISVEMLSGNELQVSKYDPPEFTKLSSDQRKVVIDIFEILEEELDFYLSELIKKKIVDKYN